ncbi:MAG: AAA family ATPase [Dehalococcoidia bacterium]|nr:AAA family ATPase [Dehalococcoidia bacterium]MCB9485242.1 AAA family ATPase [Thermoflexaceae bacterium]
MTLANDLAIASSRLRPSFPAGAPVRTTATAASGQDRARRAIAFGLAMGGDGYHIAVSGAPESGRHTLALELVRAAAAGGPNGRDWVYLHNFHEPRQPRVLPLPAGRAPALASRLAALAEACRDGLPRSFSSEAYERRAQEVLAPFIQSRSRAIEVLQNTAQALGFSVNPTQMGLLAAPLRADGKPMEAEEFARLPEDIRKPIEDRGERVQEAINATLRQLRDLDGRAHESVVALDREMALSVVGPVLDDLVRDFAGLLLDDYFAALKQEVTTHIEVFKRFAGATGELPPQVLQQFTQQREEVLDRFQVNVFVATDPAAVGAPVVQEPQLGYHDLFGRVEFENRLGMLVTDFLHVDSGAIHRANGGYLILTLEDLLTDLRAWPKLKRTLKARLVRFDDVSGVMLFPVAGLVPEGVPLDLKVVLVGSPMLLALLDATDPEFSELFKVRADFEPDVPADAAATEAYRALIRRTADECGLLPFVPSATAEVLFEGARLTGRQDRLTTRLGVVRDLCREADHFARIDGAAEVTGAHLRQAIDARRDRSGMVLDRIRSLIAEGTLHIETSGAVVGQVNGLAVVSAGGSSFGIPMRITCRTGAGRGGVVAIERETERSGSIHTKGVLVLQGFLMGLFGADDPLAFNASLTFEQSYDEVEGDSASSAELYAILASLAGLPVRQDLAVTGSVDQFGNVQAVGGVTEKVEGFFDVCCAAGLTGEQGVLVPAVNVVNLVLREDVVQAVEDGRFHLWEVRRVEQGIEMLTGKPAGKCGAFGDFPPDSVFGRVAARLADLRGHAAGRERS